MTGKTARSVPANSCPTARFSDETDLVYGAIQMFCVVDIRYVTVPRIPQNSLLYSVFLLTLLIRLLLVRAPLTLQSVLDVVFFIYDTLISTILHYIYLVVGVLSGHGHPVHDISAAVVSTRGALVACRVMR